MPNEQEHTITRHLIMDGSGCLYVMPDVYTVASCLQALARWTTNDPTRGPFSLHVARMDIQPVSLTTEGGSANG